MAPVFSRPSSPVADSGSSNKRRKKTSARSLAVSIPLEDVSCPITQAPFVNPMLCVGDGHTYECWAIKSHFQSRDAMDLELTSPVTGAVLSDETLVPNHKCLSLVLSLMERQAFGVAESERYAKERADFLERRRLQTRLSQLHGGVYEGDRACLLELGRAFELGEDGELELDRDPEEAFALYSRAYEGPRLVTALDCVAAMRVGMCHFYGSGTTVNTSAGMYYLTCAAVAFSSLEPPGSSFGGVDEKEARRMLAKALAFHRCGLVGESKRWVPDEEVEQES